MQLMSIICNSKSWSLVLHPDAHRPRGVESMSNRTEKHIIHGTRHTIHGTLGTRLHDGFGALGVWMGRVYGVYGRVLLGTLTFAPNKWKIFSERGSRSTKLLPEARMQILMARRPAQGVVVIVIRIDFLVIIIIRGYLF